MELLEELEIRVLVGDGPPVEPLRERGIADIGCLEELCLNREDLVAAIHSDYIDAGAQIIRTNSLGANSIRLKKFGLENRVNEINWTAAQIAKQSIQGKQVRVAGSVGPLGISKAEAQALGINREAVFQEQIGALLDGGVRVVIFEKFTDAEELALALHIKQSLHHCPAICLLDTRKNGSLGPDPSLQDTLSHLIDEGADIVGMHGDRQSDSLLETLASLPSDWSLAVYLDGGQTGSPDATGASVFSPEQFAETAHELAAARARIVLGGSGTTPAHIRALAQRLTPQAGSDGDFC